MNKFLFGFFGAIVCLACMGFISAASNSSDSLKFQIFGDNVIVEYFFSEADNLEIKIPQDAKAIEVNIPTYSLQELSDYKLLKIRNGENLKIKYVTSSMIEENSDGAYFIYKRAFVPIKSIDLSVALEEGFVMDKNGLLFPQTMDITSDGQRIIVFFNDFNQEQAIVTYYNPQGGNWWIYFIVFVLVALAGGFYFYMKKRFKREVKKIKSELIVKKTAEEKKEDLKENLTKNLFEDEKKIVEYLLGRENHECWTKEILKDLGITKVKLSRKLRSLEQKEIIKRLPYGNENKIRLVEK